MNESAQEQHTGSREIEIDISPIFEPFERHLQGNKRIFFSGKFGSGKTYFLNRFFEENSEKYEVFHLYPIKYQISSNEDIKDLLKYDILLELQKKKPGIFSDKNVDSIADWGRLLYVFAQGNKREIFACGLNIAESVADFPIPVPGQQLLKLGRPIREIASLVDKFNDFKERIVNGESIDVRAFLKRISKISDEDPITSIIRNNLSEGDSGSVQGDSVPVEAGKKKESVLILDDLDRLDPEHIFRILNVFSAHLGTDSESNPFGFDKVVLVGDVRNIRSIFHHRYGPEADFSGYFDKFFEAEIYHHKVDQIVENAVPELLRKFRVSDKQTKEMMDPRDGLIGVILVDLLKAASHSKKGQEVTFRTLLRPVKYPIKTFNWSDDYEKEGMDEGKSLSRAIDIITSFLIALFGDASLVVSFLDEIISKGRYPLKDSLFDHNAGRIILELYTMLHRFEKEIVVGQTNYNGHMIAYSEQGEISVLKSTGENFENSIFALVLLKGYIANKP